MGSEQTGEEGKGLRQHNTCFQRVSRMVNGQGEDRFGVHAVVDTGVTAIRRSLALPIAWDMGWSRQGGRE